jgi:hypothetical protein
MFYFLPLTSVLLRLKLSKGKTYKFMKKPTNKHLIIYFVYSSHLQVYRKEAYYCKLTKPTEQEIFAIYKYNLVLILSWLHQEFKNFYHFNNFDLGLIRHTQLFIVLFNTVHPEDGCKRQPKLVGAGNNQRI